MGLAALVGGPQCCHRLRPCQCPKWLDCASGHSWDSFSSRVRSRKERFSSEVLTWPKPERPYIHPEGLSLLGPCSHSRPNKSGAAGPGQPVSPERVSGLPRTAPWLRPTRPILGAMLASWHTGLQAEAVLGRFQCKEMAARQLTRSTPQHPVKPHVEENSTSGLFILLLSKL